MTTIRDIARIAQVSVGTVSNYLNTPDLLAEKTKKRIQKAIDELGYFPKAAARSLKSNQTRRIGIIPEIDPSDNKSVAPSDITFLEFLSAVNTIAAENKYAVLMAASLANVEEMTIYKQMVGEGQVDGFILSGTRKNDPRLIFLDEQDFPYVAFGRSNVGRGIHVDVDGALGMKLAVNHLVELGHKKIAFITPPRGLMCTQDRQSGFERALKNHNIQLTDGYLVEGGFQEESGRASMHLLLDLPDPPTAVITANDICAVGAITALGNRKLQAGKDISVIGFDDIRMASHWTPPLTTVWQPYREIGFMAGSLLIDLINGKDLQKEHILQPKLVIRNSAGTPA
ncbi:MAG: LacI family transcriptional regulator [Anaerolineaceae bacterium]|nr:LacI family transcriptional regulator [Anaerolineaceae bacterium]